MMSEMAAVFAEIKKLRGDLESALHMKFDEKVFTEDDIPRTLAALQMAIASCDHYCDKFKPRYEKNPDNQDIQDEYQGVQMNASGLVSLSRLVLAWAIAHEHEGFAHRLKTEVLPSAENLLKKVDEL